MCFFGCWLLYESVCKRTDGEKQVWLLNNSWDFYNKKVYLRSYTPKNNNTNLKKYSTHFLFPFIHHTKFLYLYKYIVQLSISINILWTGVFLCVCLCTCTGTPFSHFTQIIVLNLFIFKKLYWKISIIATLILNKNLFFKTIENQFFFFKSFQIFNVFFIVKVEKNCFISWKKKSWFFLVKLWKGTSSSSLYPPSSSSSFLFEDFWGELCIFFILCSASDIIIISISRLFISWSLFYIIMKARKKFLIYICSNHTT